MDSEVAALAGRSPKTPIDMLSLWNEIQNVKSKIKDFYFVKGVGIASNGSYTIPYSCNASTNYFGFIVPNGVDSWENSDSGKRNDNLPMVYPKVGNWSQQFKMSNSGREYTMTVSCTNGTLRLTGMSRGVTVYLIVTNSAL